LKNCSKNEFLNINQKKSALSTKYSLTFVSILLNDLPVISPTIEDEFNLSMKHIQGLLNEFYIN
jgi:hypothetical protein